jgi:hypothetical protein
VFGFYPGVGAFEMFRHRVSPSFGYAYSPTPNVTDRQRQVFALGEIREQNRLTVGVNQTFEAKYRPRAGSGPAVRTPGGADADSTIEAAAAAADTASGPRRREQAERITLLSITTDAVVYDFVAAREDGRGMQTTEIGNALQSDLLRGLQVSFAHDLFAPVASDEGVLLPGERTFSPHLTRVSAGFSLNNESWLFRALGLGGRGRDEPREGAGGRPQPMAGDPDAGPAVDLTEPEQGMIGTRRRTGLSAAPVRPIGAWSANFNYTMLRPRNTGVEPAFGGFGGFGGESQMLMANVAFQPTALWSLTWNTGYSFTTSEFTDHVLTMSRRMHDWDANFDFIRAQNGNFSFMFRVNLRANPDIKLDYEQRARRGASDPFGTPLR